MVRHVWICYIDSSAISFLSCMHEYRSRILQSILIYMMGNLNIDNKQITVDFNGTVMGFLFRIWLINSSARDSVHFQSFLSNSLCGEITNTNMNFDFNATFGASHQFFWCCQVCECNHTSFILCVTRHTRFFVVYMYCLYSRVLKAKHFSCLYLQEIIEPMAIILRRHIHTNDLFLGQWSFGLWILEGS